MNVCIKKIVLLCQLFFFMNFYAQGFVAGTLVKTEEGYIPIEEICINDRVVGNDNNNVVTKPVLLVTKKYSSSYVRVFIDDISLIVGLGQNFFSLRKQKWVDVLGLQKNDVLLCAGGGQCVVRDI